MIYIPKKNLMLPPGWQNDYTQFMDPTVVYTNRFAGRFKLDVIRSDGTIRKSTGWFPNIFTNAGLDNIGNRLSYLQYTHVGTGSATPLVTDTGLTTWLASTQSQQSSSTSTNGTSPYAGLYTITNRFAAGTATGNLSEVGMGPNATNTQMSSHALILDGTGTPTTITVLSNEALDVTYQLQNFPPLVDTNPSLVLSGTTYATTMRAALAGSSSWGISPAGIYSADTAGIYVNSGQPSFVVFSTGTLGAITGQPAGTQYPADSFVDVAYGAGTYYRDGQMGFSLTAGNAPGGAGSALMYFGHGFGRLGAFQCTFTPVIPKDGSHVMMIPVRHQWNRYP